VGRSTECVAGPADDGRVAPSVCSPALPVRCERMGAILLSFSCSGRVDRFDDGAKARDSVNGDILPPEDKMGDGSGGASISRTRRRRRRIIHMTAKAPANRATPPTAPPIIMPMGGLLDGEGGGFSLGDGDPSGLDGASEESLCSCIALKIGPRAIVWFSAENVASGGPVQEPE
jgi:hypothetical protein